MPDGSEFCQRCGARLTAGTAQNPKKKKSKKIPIIGAIAAVVVIIITALSGGEREIDYIAIVKAYKPFIRIGGGQRFFLLFMIPFDPKCAL